MPPPSRLHIQPAAIAALQAASIAVRTGPSAAKAALRLASSGLPARWPVTGWSSLIVSIYFMGGVIVAILGILGIYLGKTYDETKCRPLYVINHTTFDD